MNEILINILRGVLDYALPIVVPTVTSWLAYKFNGFINLKQQELKLNIQNQEALKLTDELFNKIRINDDILDFINKKSLEGLRLAEEKAFQSWKDDNKRELNSKEKKDVAVQYVEDSVKSITQDKNILSLIPQIIEQNLTNARQELDGLFSNLKLNFVLNNQRVPENSRNPIPQSNPTVLNIVPLNENNE